MLQAVLSFKEKEGRNSCRTQIHTDFFYYVYHGGQSSCRTQILADFPYFVHLGDDLALFL